MDWVRLASHSDFFLDTSRLTLTSSQIEETSSSYFTFSYQVDLLDGWGNDWEDTLYTNSIGNLTHGKGFSVGVWVFSLDHSSLELLDSFLVTFFDTYVYVDGITGFERRELGSRLAVFRFYNFH